MDRPRRARRIAALLLPALSLLAACTDRLTEPRSLHVPAPSFTILDAAHGGTAGFYFLPPMVPAPTYSGTFDGTKSPVVTICALAGGSCATTVATFAGSQVKVDLEAQSYGVNWKTKDAGLDPTKTYRIQVTLGVTVLGYADVVVVANGSQIKTVDRSEYAAVINGGMLAIRFRIEGAAPPPPPPTGAWETGDLITYNQDSWGTLGTTAANLLTTYFFTVYPNGIEIGIPGVGGNSAIFTAEDDVLDFLPMSGDPGALDNDLVEPSSTSAGAFAGNMLALRLDVDFADAGYLAGTTALRFGDLHVCGLTDTPSFNGLTVRQALAALEQALGGASITSTYEQLSDLARKLTESFESGVPSQWAQDHLVNGACPGGWKTGDLVTYDQDSWGGDPTSNTAALLLSNFGVVYPDGVVEAGIPGAAGFSMLFTSAAAILSYLPASGVNFRLNIDLIDPMSTSSGEFGGQVLALQLDVDFADAGTIGGTSGLVLGDLRLCNLTTTPAYNGMTVREFLAAMNTALGFGLPDPVDFDALSALTRDVSASFEGGVPSQFAQDHLVNGSCS